VTSVASRSTTSGFFALTPWSGAREPAAAHAFALAAARAASMAASAVGADLARAAIVRVIVGSEATNP